MFFTQATDFNFFSFSIAIILQTDVWNKLLEIDTYLTTTQSVNFDETKSVVTSAIATSTHYLKSKMTRFSMVIVIFRSVYLVSKRTIVYSEIPSEKSSKS